MTRRASSPPHPPSSDDSGSGRRRRRLVVYVDARHTTLLRELEGQSLLAGDVRATCSAVVRVALDQLVTRTGGRYEAIRAAIERDALGARPSAAED